MQKESMVESRSTYCIILYTTFYVILALLVRKCLVTLGFNLMQMSAFWMKVMSFCVSLCVSLSLKQVIIPFSKEHYKLYKLYQYQSGGL